jgi:hypothetical protein
VRCALRSLGDRARRRSSVEGLPLDRIGSLFVDTAGFGAVLRQRLSEYLAPAPPTSVALELEASELLQRSASLAGLGYAMRCMAAWWYVIGPADRTPAHYAGAPGGMATAAAVETIVAKRAGLRLTAAAAAERYACPVAIVRSEVRRLEEKVQGCESGW